MNDPASSSVLCSTLAPTTLSAPATINNCNVCGISSSLRCARCGHVFYCSKDHQVADWKVHKTLCASSSSSSSSLSWSQGLDAIQAYEWLIDCYRLRVDDDYVQTGSAHGLYNPESTTLDRVQEFAIFCLLAHRRKCIPQSWDWSSFLAHAISLLPYAFEKSDAQQKYGSENVAASLRGVHSLRNQANVIYGYDPQAAVFTTNGDQNMIMMQNIRRLTNRVFQIGNPIVIFSEPPTTISSSRSNSTTKPACRLFDDIGGSQAWMKLYLGLHKPNSTAAQQPRTAASSDPYESLSYFHNITPPQKSYEWLIDCYRLRQNEDLGLDGKTPMYQDVGDDHHEGTSDECIIEMVEEFTKFCLLVHARNYLPQSWSWDWKTFLTMASTRLSSGFGMDDARGKYGEEGLKYLKSFAHAVYGHAAYVDNDDDDADDLDESTCDDIMIWTDGEVLMAYDSGKPESIFLEPQTSTTTVDQPWDVPCRVFDSIGGGHTWFALFTTLKGHQQSL